MKIKNLTENAFVLTGVFRDDNLRAVLVPASGEKSFPKSRLISQPAEAFAHLAEVIEFEADDAQDSSMDDEAFEAATFSTARVEVKGEVDAKPFMIAAAHESVKGKEASDFYAFPGDVFSQHGLGIEDIVTFIDPIEPQPETKVDDED